LLLKLSENVSKLQICFERNIVPICQEKLPLTPYSDKGIGTYLFVKVPRPGDSEVIFSVFESSLLSSESKLGLLVLKANLS